MILSTYEKIKMNSRQHSLAILLSIILVASFFRLQYLDKALQKDETSSFFEPAYNLIAKRTPMYFENSLDKFGARYFNIHTPLYILLLSPITYHFGLNPAPVRLFTAMFSIASIVLVYFMGLELKGKKLALFSAFLLAINSLHVENAQLIDIDGSFFTFFVLLATLFFMKWDKSNKKTHYIIAVTAMILLFLAKEAAVLLLPPILLFLYKKKETKKFFKLVFPTMAVVIPILFLLGIIFSTNFFTGILKQFDQYVVNKYMTNRSVRLYQFLGIITWSFTPPLLLLFIISLPFYLKLKDRHFNLLILTTLLFAVFYSSFFGVARYFVPIVPFVCLIIANYILETGVLNGRKSLLILAVTTLSVLLLFYSLRIRADILFLSDAKTNLYLISVPYLLTLVSLIALTWNKKLTIVLLLGLLIGFNMYFSQEYINPIVTPDWGPGILETVSYIKSQSIKGPILSMHEIAFYSNLTLYSIELPTTTPEYVNALIDEGKLQYVIYRTNTILINPNVIRFVENNCEKLMSTYSRGVETVKVYRCHPS